MDDPSQAALVPDPNQRELPPWPMPRWPTMSYMLEASIVYLFFATVVGVVFLFVAIMIVRPLGTMIFVSGAVAGATTVIIGIKWCRSIARRIAWIFDGFVYHA
jgi:hypothetical protein